jgi:hypothetical protein
MCGIASRRNFSRRLHAGWIVLALVWQTAGQAGAQEAVRTLCVDGAPGASCTDDRFEVVFPAAGALDNSLFRYSRFVAGTTVHTKVVIDVMSTRLQGWTYAVKHEPGILQLQEDSISTRGTLIDPAHPRSVIRADGIDMTMAVAGGWQSVVVLGASMPSTLPLGRHAVASASYTLIADAGIAGSKLELAPIPPGVTAVQMTIDGAARQPRKVIDGLVQRVVVPEEICDNGIDDDGDGLIDDEDPDCMLCICEEDCPDNALVFGPNPSLPLVDATRDTGFSIHSRNSRPLFAFQFGVRTTTSGGENARTTYEFSGDLGTDRERLVELLFTNDLGESVTPRAANRLVATTPTIVSIERGAAIIGFLGGDFLEFDLEPGTGGPGFFVGYVSDLDGDINKIPATMPLQGNVCQVNELLKVRLAAGDCPDYAFYFGPAVTTEPFDATATASIPIGSRNIGALFGFQFGVRTTTAGGMTTYEFADDIGTDSERLVEVIMTDNMGNTIRPQTPNTAISAAVPVVEVVRGAATAGFSPGDVLQFDLEPGAGGPGFFVGYLSDLDSDANQIPATPAGDATSCPLNEVLVIKLQSDGEVCPDTDFAFFFGPDARTGEIDARGQDRYVISGRNTRPIFAFQLGVQIASAGQTAVHRFSGELGTDSERLVELLMTDNQGNSVTPSTPNTLRIGSGRVLSIERGQALQGFGPGDFLQFDVQPGVGGPGYFLGYVADLDGPAVIPATSAADDCAVHELLVVRVEGVPVDCPAHDFALYFGGAATTATVALSPEEESFSITGRNARPLLAFQFGVRATTAGAVTTYAFSGDLGTDAERLVEIIMTDNQGNSVTPATPNRLEADALARVVSIERGQAIAAFADGDFLEYDLNPGTGGPGFFVGYVSDLDSNANQIRATSADPCNLNELLRVNVRLTGDLPFFRGDADGNGRINIHDAVLIIQSMLSPRFKTFDCDDLYDADDNGILEFADGLPPLIWLFQMGPPLPQPFFACALDPTEDGLGCRQSNCVAP